MDKLRHRYAFDVILSALLIFEMFFELTGDVAHEIVGCAFFATIVAHLVLSRKWMGATARQLHSGKRMKLANKLRLVLAVGLAVAFVALMASSIAISMVLIKATGVNLAGDARQVWLLVHTASSYALCGFTIAHVLVHWMSICSVFRIPYDPARRQAINAGASVVVAISAVALGIGGAQAIESIVNPMPVTGDGVSSKETPQAEAAPSASETETAASARPAKRKKDSLAQSAPSAPSEESTSEPATESASESKPSEPTGYCPLCRLHCPLSDPQCNRPYQAGLI